MFDFSVLIAPLAGAAAGGVAGPVVTRALQPKPVMEITWDVIGSGNGTRFFELAYDSGGFVSVPFMDVTVKNVGHVAASDVRLNTSSCFVGHHNDKNFARFSGLLDPGKEWVVSVPLMKIRDTFDHPQFVTEALLREPLVKLSWRAPNRLRRAKRQQRLRGEWLTWYNQNFYSEGVGVRNQRQPQKNLSKEDGSIDLSKGQF